MSVRITRFSTWVATDSQSNLDSVWHSRLSRVLSCLQVEEGPRHSEVDEFDGARDEEPASTPSRKLRSRRVFKRQGTPLQALSKETEEERKYIQLDTHPMRSRCAYEFAAISTLGSSMPLPVPSFKICTYSRPPAYHPAPMMYFNGQGSFPKSTVHLSSCMGMCASQRKVEDLRVWIINLISKEGVASATIVLRNIHPRKHLLGSCCTAPGCLIYTKKFASIRSQI